jgi:hypothetical protein
LLPPADTALRSLRDTLNRITETIGATRHDEIVNAA